jgi:hypothetical protein
MATHVADAGNRKRSGSGVEKIDLDDDWKDDRADDRADDRDGEDD